MAPISKEEIQLCLSLLHGGYHNLCPVHIGTKIRSFFVRLRWGFEAGYLQGYYHSIKKHIYLFPDVTFSLCEWEDDPSGLLAKKKQVIFTLFHEVRHAYQHQTAKWMKQWHNDELLEKDANRFAYRMMWKHKKEIEKILNVEVE